MRDALDDILSKEGYKAMLDPWIIQRILDEEERRRQEDEKRYGPKPLEREKDPYYRPDDNKPDEDNDRGVTVIDLKSYI